MATSYRNSSKRLPITAASGAIASGAIVAQEGLQGVALEAMVSGGSGTIGAEGIWNLTVPSGTVKGDKLYLPGAPATTAVAGVLTKTASSNTLFGIALSPRDASNNALVLLAAQLAAQAA